MANITEQGRRLYSGDQLFELKATHGLPLDFALDRIIGDKGYAVDWPAFIEAARRNDWFDFQTYEVVSHAMQDAMLPRAMQASILDRFRAYMLTHPHPQLSRGPVTHG